MPVCMMMMSLPDPALLNRLRFEIPGGPETSGAEAGFPVFSGKQPSDMFSWAFDTGTRDLPPAGDIMPLTGAAGSVLPIANPVTPVLPPVGPETPIKSGAILPPGEHLPAANPLRRAAGTHWTGKNPDWKDKGVQGADTGNPETAGLHGRRNRAAGIAPRSPEPAEYLLPAGKNAPLPKSAPGHDTRLPMPDSIIFMNTPSRPPPHPQVRIPGSVSAPPPYALHGRHAKGALHSIPRQQHPETVNDPVEHMLPPRGFAVELPAPAPPATAQYAQHVPRPIMQQLAEVLPPPAAAGERTIELHLNPPELGRVRLSLSGADGMMTMNISADRSDTLDLIRRHIDWLATDFRDLGYGSARFTFGRNPHERPDHPGSLPVPGERPAPEAPAPALTRIILLGRIDIRI